MENIIDKDSNQHYVPFSEINDWVERDKDEWSYAITYYYENTEGDKYWSMYITSKSVSAYDIRRTRVVTNADYVYIYRFRQISPTKINIIKIPYVSNITWNPLTFLDLDINGSITMDYIYDKIIEIEKQDFNIMESPQL